MSQAVRLRPVVKNYFGGPSREPCDQKTGRPLDATAQSWWDAGFKVAGYVRPPQRNFRKYISEVLRGLR